MIAFKGMTMPESCRGCVLRSYQGADVVCSVTGYHIGRWERIGRSGRDYKLRYEGNTDKARRTDCPLVEVKGEREDGTGINH